MRSNYSIPLLALLLVFFIASCSPTQVKLKVIYSTDEPIGEISKTIKKVIENQYPHYTIELVIGEGSHANLDSISAGSADITIVENHIDYVEGVRSISVLYPQILHILYLNDEVINSFEDLVYNHTLFIGSEGSASNSFMKELFSFYRINERRVKIVNNIFEAEVLVGFNDVLGESDLLGLGDFKIYSFGEVSQYGHGSILEAIALQYPKVRPYIIPKKIYGQITPEPVLTLSSDAVLVTREDLPNDVVSNITRAIFRDKQMFNLISPLIFTGLKENFDRDYLDFPLHEGARQYLDRDEPTFFERYAESIGVAFSILIALVSAAISFSKWRKQAKKDRVDVFYEELMVIKNEIHSLKNVQMIVERINKIQEIQSKAFNMLIAERLEANESFRIFMELSKETIIELRMRAKAIKMKKVLIKQ